MGGTGPGTQQALHKYLMHDAREGMPSQNCCHGQSMPFWGGGQACGRTIWLLGEPAWGTVGNAERLNRAGLCAVLGSSRKRCRTISCLDYGCFN